MLKGTYVDPDAGRITFRRYADEWLAAATSDESTRIRLEYEFRLHVHPHSGDMPLTAIQPSTLRAWAHRLQQKGLAASYRRVLFNDVSMIFNAAVDDRKVPLNPFSVKTVRPPKYEPPKVVPWTTGVRAACRASMIDRYRITVDLGAGCGLRQAEIFGVSPDDIDPHRPVLHVTRQVKLVAGKLFFAPPKGGKVRDVPLPESVARRLSVTLRTVRPSTSLCRRAPHPASPSRCRCT